VIYLYAILAAPVSIPSLVGLDDAPVEARSVAGTTVAMTEHADVVPALDRDAVLRHARVVEQLAEGDAAVLPVRLGVAFADELALQRALREQAGDLEARLELVRGCVELGLRVLAPDGERERGAFAGGAEYMHARLREESRRERLAGELHECVAHVARDSVQRASRSGSVLLDAAYLVPGGAVATFREEVERLEQSHPELAVLCTGPWPAYSFAASAGGATS